MFQLNKILVLLAIFASFSFAGPVYVYGALKACTIGGKGQICGSGSYANTAVQLRGVSFGWSNNGWDSEAFFNPRAVSSMVDGWKAEIIRVPLGIGGNPGGGYDEKPDDNWRKVKTLVDQAIANDVYVIIDWHSHTAANNTTERNKAKDFFANVVSAYHNNSHVIFEIFNEPTSANSGTWSNIKAYADEVVSAIRAKGAKNLILVGTPTWSQDVDVVTSTTKVTDTENNIGYVLHFYAQEHPLNNFRNKVNSALSAGFPVFVTEYGTTDASGGNGKEGGSYNSHSATNSDEWHTFMNQNKISSCAWQVDDKYAQSSFFGIYPDKFNGFPQNAANFVDESKMTESGKYIFRKLKSYANNTDAPWRGQPQPSSSSGGGSGPTTIDDFKDGDNWAFTLEPWYAYTDASEPDAKGLIGASTITNLKGADGEYVPVFKDGSDWVVGIKGYTLSKGTLDYDPYVAFGLRAQDNQYTYDLSKCTGGFSYRFKGVAHKFKILQTDVTDFGYHDVAVNASTGAWKTETIQLIDLTQPSWGKLPNGDPNPKPVTQDVKKASAFAWEVNAGIDGTPTTSGSLLISDFKCLGSMQLPLMGTDPSSPSEGGDSSSSEGSGEGDSSSSSNTQSPIAISKIANANSAQLINNGVSLQVKNTATLEVFNLNGNAIRKMNFSSGVYSVKLQDLPKGLYIAKIRYGNSSSEIMKVPIR
jgi:aryl-phospho-beta-D-glucosidase BglC (GH1 family)